MKDGIKVYDIENHFNTKLMLEKEKELGIMEMSNMASDDFDLEAYAKVEEIAVDLGEKRLAAMDAANIDYAHLSLTTPGPEAFPVDVSRKIAEDANTRLGAAIKAHPDRFGGWMALAPEDPEWSIKEIDRCLEMGLWGWSCLSNINGKMLDDPKYWPILEKVNEAKMPMYLHPNFSAIKELNEFGYCINGPSYGFTIDTQLCVMRMICRGIFDMFPNLTVFLGHDGEAFPFLKDRIDTAYRQGIRKPTPNIETYNKHAPSYYFEKHIKATTSGNFLPEAFHVSLKVMGPDNVFLATDFPYENVANTVKLVIDDGIILRCIREAVAYKNAEGAGFCPKK